MQRVNNLEIHRRIKLRLFLLSTIVSSLFLGIVGYDTSGGSCHPIAYEPSRTENIFHWACQGYTVCLLVDISLHFAFFWLDVGRNIGSEWSLCNDWLCSAWTIRGLIACVPVWLQRDMWFALSLDLVLRGMSCVASVLLLCQTVARATARVRDHAERQLVD